MPIRRLTIHACAYGVMLACSSQVLSDVSSWNGSYVAQGGCYCVGEQSRNIDSQIVPTPVGGQSVAQVCDRVSDGPALQKVDGKFNFTVYPDAQCGNGPFPDSTTAQNTQCLGHLGISGEDCALRGPRWDLSNAYSKEAKKPQVNAENSMVTGGSRHIAPPARKIASNKKAEHPVINTSVAEIARTRANSKKVVRRASTPAVPETREQIRARQLEHLAAARERAKLAKSAQSGTAQESIEGLLPDVAAASVKTEKIETVQSEVSKPVKSKASDKAAVDSVTDTAQAPAVTKNTPAVAALKLPAVLNYGNPDFDYFEAAPVAYDFGGAGLSVAASKSSHGRLQYVLKAAAADTYREAAMGVGMFFKPVKAGRTTMMVKAGLEYGLFNFRNNDVKADLSDTGAFMELATRIAFTRKFELQAGVKYSRFFEGDVGSYGAAFFQLSSKFDLTAKAEIGDNDLFGFGIRYHY